MLWPFALPERGASMDHHKYLTAAAAIIGLLGLAAIAVGMGFQIWVGR